MRLVVIIGDIAVGMVVVFLIKRINLGEVVSNRSNVVCHNISHDPNTHGVGGIDHLLQRGLVSEESIHLFPVLEEIPVVRCIHVIDDWAYPDGIETQILDVGELLGNTFPVTSTIDAHVARRSDISIASPEAIGQQLVDGPGLPFVCVG